MLMPPVSPIMQTFAVAAGGAAGALMRYGITLAAVAIPGGSAIWGTTVANVVGCGLMGLAIPLSVADPPPQWAGPAMQLAVRVGLIGSLTTMSTFVAESFVMATTDPPAKWVVYVAANLILGTLVFWASFGVGHRAF